MGIEAQQVKRTLQSGAGRQGDGATQDDQVARHVFMDGMLASGDQRQALQAG